MAAHAIRMSTAPAQVEIPQRLIDWADGIARRIARTLPPCFELDDLKQAARMAVMRYLPRYDGRNGTPDEGFLYPYVTGAVRMAVRRREWRETVTDRIPSSTVAPGNLEADLERGMSSKLVQWLIRERLTDDEQYIIRHVLAGHTVLQIQRKLRWPRKRVDAVLRTAYEQIREDCVGIGMHAPPRMAITPDPRPVFGCPVVVIDRRQLGLSRRREHEAQQLELRLEEMRSA